MSLIGNLSRVNHSYDPMRQSQSSSHDSLIGGEILYFNGFTGPSRVLVVDQLKFDLIQLASTAEA